MANYLSRYGLDYYSPVGQDSQDILATDPRMYPTPVPASDRNANALERYMPQGLIDWGNSVKAAQGKPSIFGKALGAIGLDESGRRGQTSWGDAAKATMWLPGELVEGLVGSAHNIAQNDGQSFHTSPDAADRARAAQYSGDVFNVAGALPMGGALAGRMAPGVAKETVPLAKPEIALPELPRVGSYQPDGLLRPDNQAMTLPGGLRAHDGASATKTSAYEAYLRNLEANGSIDNAMGFTEFNKHLSDSGVMQQHIAGRNRWIGIAATPPLHDAGQYSPLHNIGGNARDLMPPPGQDPVSGVTRMDGSPLYSNSKEGALPGLVLQGYRGYNPDKGIGPAPGKPQAVWATPDKGTADAFGWSRGAPGVVDPVEMRFNNPAVVDAKGANFDNIPVRDGKGILGLLSPTMRYDADTLALAKQAQGHDGLHIKNVRETGEGNSQRTADQYVALQRGTVYDPSTGNLLWSNSKEASLPGLLSQGKDTPQGITDIVSRYGWAGAAAMLGMSADDLKAQAQQPPSPASDPLYR